jgi:hypothetical protein
MSWRTGLRYLRGSDLTGSCKTSHFSQTLSDDADKLAREPYYETNIDAVGMRVQSIAAICKQSVSLNAVAHEKLQEIFDAIATVPPPNRRRHKANPKQICHIDRPSLSATAVTKLARQLRNEHANRALQHPRPRLWRLASRAINREILSWTGYKAGTRSDAQHQKARRPVVLPG